MTKQEAANKNKIPASTSGMDALGALIMRQFPNIGLQVNRQTIHNWRNLKFVPPSCNVPFPPPTNGNRYNTADCFAWIETYFPEGENVPRHGATQDLKNKINERKLRLLDLEVGEAEGKLTDKKIAKNTMIAAIKKYHGIVRTHLEKLEVKAFTEYATTLELSDNHKAALQSFLIQQSRNTIEKIEDACERISKGDDE